MVHLHPHAVSPMLNRYLPLKFLSSICQEFRKKERKGEGRKEGRQGREGKEGGEGREEAREGGRKKRKKKEKEKEKEFKDRIVLPLVPKKNRLSGIIDIFLLTNVSDLQNTAQLYTLYFNNFQGFLQSQLIDKIMRE